MNCNSGQRKVFADEVVASVTELARKHGLQDVVVHRDADPVLVAARGCLKDEKGDRGDERIELILQMSPSLERAETQSLIGSQVAADVSGDVYRAFDLSEVVARDSVAKAAKREDEKC